MICKRSKELIEKRYHVGWGCAAEIDTEEEELFVTSLSIETENASAVLCIETGTILEANKFNEKVTHCLCLVRDDEKSPFKILTLCGICQERLRFWGKEVQVAVTTISNSLKFITLDEIQLYHWTCAYSAE